MFGSLVRGSVFGSVEVEFGASGGLKEEEGCAAAVKEVELVVGSPLCSGEVLKVGPSDISEDWGTVSPSLLNGRTPTPRAGL